MSTRDLIDAIESGNSSAIQQHFQDAIMSRVAERLDTMRIETAKNMFKSSVNEAVINTSDYHATSEKSQFGGFRPHVKHKDTGDTMYLSRHSYSDPEDAKDHAETYLKAYAQLGPIHADRAASSYANANKHKLIGSNKNMNESINEQWGNYTVHWSSPNSDKVWKSTVYGPSADPEKMKSHLIGNKMNIGKIHKVEPHVGKIEPSAGPGHRSYVESVDAETAHLHQVLADNDINAMVSDDTVHVDNDDVEKAQTLVKTHGYDHKVVGGLNEVLSKKDPASKWIADFVASDDPKFKGKTKKERIKMALGAYYGARRNESAELDEGFPYDVDHMPGRRLSMADVNKISKYTVATNAIGGHKEQRVEVDATSKNHARNLAADHFMKNGLKPRVHFDGVRVVNEETECNKDDKMNETSCSTKKKWGAIKDSMKDSVKK